MTNEATSRSRTTQHGQSLQDHKVIPDEAVHAALDALPYQAAEYVDMDYMRAALEAAAPYMMADRKVMAGVLAAHQIKTGGRGMSPRCSCGWLGQVFGNDFREDFITHQADMLDVQQKATP